MRSTLRTALIPTMWIFLVTKVAQQLINSVGLVSLNAGGEPDVRLAATEKPPSCKAKRSQAAVTPALSAAPCFPRRASLRSPLC